MINYTEHNKLAMPDLNSPADIRVISEVINDIDDGLSKFYVATQTSANVYKVTTGLNKTNLANGYSIRLAIPTNSTGAVSIVVDDCNAVAVKDPSGKAATKFKQNGVYSLTYYNGNFILASGENVDYDSTSVGTDGSKVLTGTTFVGSDGEVHNGTMPNNGTLETTLTTHGATYNIPSGYTSGGQVKTNITNCTAGNIKYNVPVGGVTGSFTGDGTIDANKVVKNYVGYSKGSRIVGTATIESLGGLKGKKGTIPAKTNSFTIIDLGFTPNFVYYYIGSDSLFAIYYKNKCITVRNLNDVENYSNYIQVSGNNITLANNSTLIDATWIALSI